VDNLFRALVWFDRAVLRLSDVFLFFWYGLY
jgi:hypothetical protein